ncbi:MAG: MarR family transcriptional regulator [Verrucomicrobiota bacterium]
MTEIEINWIVSILTIMAPSLKNGTSPDVEAFGPLLHGTARSWRLRLDERLKPMGLSQARWRTLLHLSLAAAPLTQAEIASRLGVEEPTLVTLLHRLEGEGWVARRRCVNDRRCKTVHLQRRAQRLIDKINRTARELRYDLIRDIPAHDLQTCMRVLEKISQRTEAPENRHSEMNRVRKAPRK